MTAPCFCRNNAKKILFPSICRINVETACVCVWCFLSTDKKNNQKWSFSYFWTWVIFGHRHCKAKHWNASFVCFPACLLSEMFAFFCAIVFNSVSFCWLLFWGLWTLIVAALFGIFIFLLLPHLIARSFLPFLPLPFPPPPCRNVANFLEVCTSLLLFRFDHPSRGPIWTSFFSKRCRCMKFAA